MLVIGWIWTDGEPCRPVAVYEKVDGAAPFTVDGGFRIVSTERDESWPTP